MGGEWMRGWMSKGAFKGEAQGESRAGVPGRPGHSEGGILLASLGSARRRRISNHYS